MCATQALTALGRNQSELLILRPGSVGKLTSTLGNVHEMRHQFMFAARDLVDMSGRRHVSVPANRRTTGFKFTNLRT